MKDIMVYDEAHYFGDATGDNINLGGVITEMTESSNPAETEKQYIHQKSSITKVTGYANEFPITMDMVQGDEVSEDFYNLFYTRATGSDLERDHYIVNLWESEGENTYKARKIRQTVSITEATGGAGEQKQISGSLRGGDFEYGTFNVSTKKFTADV
ncbi:MAG: hypothetical protein IJZ77_04975 [Bacilli bacterium]|nr:hypothetical protein [Bacilli bacterium]